MRWLFFRRLRVGGRVFLLKRLELRSNKTSAFIRVHLRFLLLFAAVSPVFGQAPAPDREARLKAELPRVPPTAPADALRAFRLASPGLRVDLVAAEPLVFDPIDLAFDENGRMWVVEMNDYPFDEREGMPPRGRIRLLEDADGDGRVDRGTVLADGLRWPTGLALWDGGAFVVSAPDILYLKDTDGDGRADVREVVLTGFERKNVQYLANSLRWGLDGWLYGAGGSGGEIRSRRKPDAPPIRVGGRDFRFRPSGELEALSGGGQFGNTFDDFGRRFVCQNSQQARHVVLEQRELARNPALGAPPALQSIASDGDSGPVFRLSPPEPWRVVRTRLRLSGEVPGLIEHGGAVTGYFTSATGITVYRGTALGPGFYGNLFIGDVASNLVHRKTLAPAGSTFRADRADAAGEFLASTDLWFRPAAFANGPDGALYVCDVYRECIEHPYSIPDSIKQHLDLTSGHDRGRIWRVAREGAPRGERPALGNADVDTLLAALRRPDGWWRDTAARLLLQRRDPAAVAPLESLAASPPDAALPASRAAALGLLSALDALRPDILLIALQDASPDVREVAVRFAPRVLPASSAVFEALLELASDPAPRVRLALALTLGDASDPRATDALAGMAARDAGDEWFQTAVLSSLGPLPARDPATPPRSIRFLRTFLHACPHPAASPLLGRLLDAAGARGDAVETTAALDAVTDASLPLPEAGRWSVLARLGDGLRRGGRSLGKALDAGGDPAPGVARARALLDAAAGAALDGDRAPADRAAASTLLAHAPYGVAAENLFPLVHARQPPGLRLTAARALAAQPDVRAGALLLENWKSFGPDLRAVALDGILRRSDRIPALLDAVEAGTIAPADLDAARRQELTAALKDEALRARAAKLLDAGRPTDRNAAIDALRPALALAGEAARGLAVFRKSCATCHRAGGEGADVGPDLSTVRGWDPERILTAVLDPNREVAPAYFARSAVTEDGIIVSGLVVAETDTAVTFKRAGGETETVLRANLAELWSAGLSLMPEALEREMDAQGMADLIAFLRGEAPAPK